MKKIMFLAVLVALLASLFGGATMVLADDGDKLKEAGQRTLEATEEILSKQLRVIERYVQTVADDRLITKNEMVNLRDKVGNFKQTKRQGDKYLEFYGRETTTELDKALVEAVTDYFDRHALTKRDYHGEAKKLFVEATGQDVVVQKGIVIDAISILFMVVAAIFLFLTIICALPKRITGGVVAYSMFFIVALLVLFLA